MKWVVQYCLMGFSVWWLSGCGPFYRDFTFYDPPATEQGKNCAFHCEQQRSSCDTLCQQTYDACYQDAQMRSKMEYLEAKGDWLNQREHCLSKLKAQVKGESACHPDSEPREHSYVDASPCQRDCGCERDFARCFQLCGGQIRYERRCVSGCE